MGRSPPVFIQIEFGSEKKRVVLFGEEESTSKLEWRTKGLGYDCYVTIPSFSKCFPIEGRRRSHFVVTWPCRLNTALGNWWLLYYWLIANSLMRGQLLGCRVKELIQTNLWARAGEGALSTESSSYKIWLLIRKGSEVGISRLELLPPCRN